MKHLCATLLLLCSGLNPQLDGRDLFIEQITNCALQYNATTISSERVPIHLVVAVAAHESAWGKSRFALEGNNYFGIKTLSQDPDKYMVPKNNKKVKLQKYETMCSSVDGFMELVTISPRYKEFQEELEKQWLVDKVEYNKLLSSMIRFSTDKEWKIKGLDIIGQIKK